MNWNAIAEILAASGVVISLFYLGTQIRAQNRESKLAAMHEISEAYRDSYGQFRDSELADFFVRGSNFINLMCFEAWPGTPTAWPGATWPTYIFRRQLVIGVNEGFPLSQVGD